MKRKRAEEDAKQQPSGTFHQLVRDCATIHLLPELANLIIGYVGSEKTGQLVREFRLQLDNQVCPQAVVNTDIGLVVLSWRLYSPVYLGSLSLHRKDGSGYTFLPLDTLNYGLAAWNNTIYFQDRNKYICAYDVASQTNVCKSGAPFPKDCTVLDADQKHVFIFWRTSPCSDGLIGLVDRQTLVCDRQIAIGWPMKNGCFSVFEQKMIYINPGHGIVLADKHVNEAPYISVISNGFHWYTKDLLVTHGEIFMADYEHKRVWVWTFDGYLLHKWPLDSIRDLACMCSDGEHLYLLFENGNVRVLK